MAAGWRLGRKKVLFLGVSFFISLALFMRLNPSPPPPSCLSQLDRISWTHLPSPSWSWAPSFAPSCVFRRFSRAGASEILSGSWILVAGDSQARLLVLALLRLLLDPASVASLEPDLFRRHSDYHIALADRGIKVDFAWAPYESNLTYLIQEIRFTPRYPDIIVLGSGLWHMLHMTDPTNYGNALADVKRAARSLLEPGAPLQPHLFWLSLPNLVNSMLNTEEKRERMNSTMLEAYAHEVYERKIMRKYGGPFLLLDVGSLTSNCGLRCTADGMHYDSTVYDAVLHVMLNALLIESRPRV